MAFEQPELSTALRELAIERDNSLASERRTYVDYDAEGKVERLTWPDEVGEMPDAATIQAKVELIRQKPPPPVSPTRRQL